MSRAGTARPDASDRGSGGHAATSTADVRAAVPTPEEAARLLARPAEGEWAALRRQDGVTIFWYACQITELLKVFSRVSPEQTVLESLDLHEYTSTRVIQVEDLPSSGPQLQVVLHGHDLLGVKEPEGRPDNFDFDRTFRETVTPAAPSVPAAYGTEEAAGVTVWRGGAETVWRGGAETVESKVPSVPAAYGTEEAARVTVRGYPFLDAPQRVTVGVSFELEIGLSGAPVVGVATTGPLVLHAPAGTTTIPVEVQVVADGFSAPQGWRRTLDVAVADPTKARVRIPLIAMVQADPVRLTSLSVHFVVGGVARGAASRNVVVETKAEIAPPPDGRGLSWVDAAEPPPVITLDAIPFVPDIEVDITKPDGIR